MANKKGNNYKMGGITLIFIDSNIYLRFFDSNQPNYKQLLKILIQLKGQIFVTRQIVNEVLRNKAHIFERSFLNYIKQGSETFNNVQLPEHLDTEEDGKIKEWNKRRNNLKTENDILVRDLKQIFDETFRNIYLSKDEVSKGLNKLFENNKIETEDEFNNAKKRKTVGNPPGKNSDSLGDQINWEQILNEAANVDNLYIISNDHDYFITINEDLYLNPLLDEEIKRSNSKINMFCFNKLSDALQKLNNQSNRTPLKIPEASVIEKIKEEEVENELDYSVGPAFQGTTIYDGNHHKLRDSLYRIGYMWSRGLLYSHEIDGRLKDLGIPEKNIKKILKTGYISAKDLGFLSNYSPKE